MAFYFFLNTGLSMWALGLRINEPEGSDKLTANSPYLQPEQAQAVALRTTARSKALSAGGPGFNLGDAADYFLLAVAPLTLGMYYLGAAQIDSKVPIYIMMSAIFSVLTYRFYKVGGPWLQLWGGCHC